MVSHPETGSDSPIGSDQYRGRDTRRLVGLASLEDWRFSYLCSELIPSVAERSTLFVKELSFPQTAPN